MLMSINVSYRIYGGRCSACNGVKETDCCITLAKVILVCIVGVFLRQLDKWIKWIIVGLSSLHVTITYRQDRASLRPLIYLFQKGGLCHPHTL